MRHPHNTCSICGNQAAAVWHGQQGVYVCGQCAVDVLPALAADAIHLPQDHPAAANEAKRHLQAIERTYWRALALRLLNERAGR